MAYFIFLAKWPDFLRQFDFTPSDTAVFLVEFSEYDISG